MRACVYGPLPAAESFYIEQATRPVPQWKQQHANMCKWAVCYAVNVTLICQDLRSAHYSLQNSYQISTGHLQTHTHTRARGTYQIEAYSAFNYI